MFENPPIQNAFLEAPPFRKTWEAFLENRPDNAYRRFAKLIADLESFDVTENFESDGLELLKLFESFYRASVPESPSPQEVAKHLYSVLMLIEDEISLGPRFCPPQTEYAYETEIYPLSAKLTKFVLKYYGYSESEAY